MRSSLIDGVLKTVAHNKYHSNPIKGTNVYVDNIDVDVTEDLLRENFNHYTCFIGDIFLFAPQLHESAGGLPKTKLVSHSCSLPGSTSAIEVSIPIAFVLPAREHECNESFKLGRPPAFS
ncbi:hypothetical protein Tco_1410053 [Tanacetum coccineum]